MCGIVGLFAFSASGRSHHRHLAAACASLAARGPDNEGIYQDADVGLGHRRLSVIDLSTEAHQPMETERYVLTFNGEIYNYRTLRKELSDRGYHFRTQSDTEVLLQGYVAWGEAVLAHLEGFFSFCIYDKDKKSLFLARDRMGKKPLYYAMDEDKFIFGSELKALYALRVRKELDSMALYTYLQLGYIPAPRTILTDARKLSPGHALHIEHKKQHCWCYYQVKCPPNAPNAPIMNGVRREKELFDTLENAVKARLQTDVPLGAFLSGGLDSSILVGLAARHKPDLQTFSIGYKDEKFFDESAYAQIVAQHFGTKHHLFQLSEQDLLEEIHAAIDYLDEPFGDSSALPTYILSKKTRNVVTVALSGDGADELFAGYSKYSAWLRAISPPFSDHIIAKSKFLWGWLPKSRNGRLPNLIRRAWRYSTALGLSPAERYWYLASLQQEGAAMSLLHPKQRNFLDAEYIKYKAKYAGNDTDWSDFNQVLQADVSLVLAGDMLTKVDRMSMAHGLEIRSPFLDQRVVKLAFSLSAADKVDANGVRKSILRKTFSNFLPPVLLQRPKQGFEVPLLHWMRNGLRNDLQKWVFNRERIEEQGVLNWPAVARIERALFSCDPHDAAAHTWCLYALQRFLAKNPL